MHTRTHTVHSIFNCHHPVCSHYGSNRRYHTVTPRHLDGQGYSMADSARSKVQCCSCKRPADGETAKLAAKTKTGCESYRCADCNSMRGKVDRVLKACPKLKDDWKEVSAETKQEFLQTHLHFTGEELKKCMQEIVIQSKNNTRFSEFSVLGDWYDEEQLKEKYKNKPEQLANLFQYARQLTHPTRRCILWEDLTFKSASSEKTEDREETRRTVTSNINIRRAKRKVEKKDDNAHHADPKAKKMKASIAKKINRLKETLVVCKDEMTVQLEEASAESIKDFISPKVIQHAEAKAPLIEAALESIDLVEADTAEQCIEEVTKNVNTVQAILSLLKNQVSGMKSFTEDA